MGRSQNIIGIDVGSSNIRAVIAQDVSFEEPLKVVGVGSAPSSGMRRGAVIDIEETVRSIGEALEKAERMANINAGSAYVSVGGPEIYIQKSKGVVAVGRADGEVSPDDVSRVINAAQAISIPQNREIIHIVPRYFRLDDQDGIKDPIGMTGVRLEVDALIIEGSSAHLKNLEKCLAEADISAEDIILEPIAASKAVLSKKQKELGVALIDIGGGTTSVAVFEEGDLLHTAVLPVGAGHITNDIAIGLRTSVEVAEKIKLSYGSAISRNISKKEDIDMTSVDSQEEGLVSHHHVAEIIEARMEEIFSLVQNELKAIGKAGLLPAGVVLTGGGAKLPQTVELAKEMLGLPAQVGYPIRLSGILNQVDDPSFASAVGLLLWAKEQQARQGKNNPAGKVMGALARNTEDIAGKVKEIFKKFMP